MAGLVGLAALCLAHLTWAVAPHRCVEEYKLAPDGKSCLMLSDICEGPKCLKSDAKFNETLFGEMLHGYNNRSQHVNQGQVFQMTFRYVLVLLLALGVSGWWDGTEIQWDISDLLTRGRHQENKKHPWLSYLLILPSASSSGPSWASVCLVRMRHLQLCSVGLSQRCCLISF